jgi:hypothetical protein
MRPRRVHDRVPQAQLSIAILAATEHFALGCTHGRIICEEELNSLSAERNSADIQVRIRL